MDRSEILKLVARVRRAMPRNVDVMALCEVAEGLEHPVEPRKLGTHRTSEGKFDRRGYQRDYMRERRRKFPKP